MRGRPKNRRIKDTLTEVVYLPQELVPFTDETIQSLKELGEVIKSIRARLLREGYTIKDGKIIKEPVIRG